MIKKYFVILGKKVQLGEKNLHLLIFLTEKIEQTRQATAQCDGCIPVCILQTRQV